MRPCFLLFLTVWAMVVTPSLCEAGLLAHLCEAHAEDDCRHEQGCEDDPCEKPALRPESSNAVADGLALAASALPTFAFPLSVSSPRLILAGRAALFPAALEPSRPLPLRL